MRPNRLNHLLNAYRTACKKLARLVSLNKNHRKQDILRRRIAHLYRQLTALKTGFASVVLTAAAGTITTGTQAQYFAAPVVNGFNLDSSAVNHPAFADLDNDGDLDMMTGDTLGNNLYYKNSGTATLANFDAPLYNPFSLSATPYYSYPCFVDIDNDGDFDILSGDVYGFFYYFQNTGTASAPSFDPPVTAPFSLPLYIYDYATIVAMVDLDNDGDKDLMAGGFYGDFHYFENTGTASSANFAAEVLNPFSINTPGDSLSSPTFGDLDGDGDLDMISGSYYGSFHYYENTGTASSPTFAAPQIDPFGLTGLYYGLSFPTLVDLDNDGDLDIMAGEYYGSFNYFENDESLRVEQPEKNSGLSVFPNPSNGQITLLTGSFVAESVTIFNSCGQKIFSISPMTNRVYVDMSGFDAGAYIMQVLVNGEPQFLRVVKQ